MANVKVFADRQTNRRTGQKLYAPDLSIRGHKNIFLFKKIEYSLASSRHILLDIDIIRLFTAKFGL
jgi:hypothetical protein